MIKSSSDINYRKSSAERLAIGFCLYIAITFHNNLAEAKIANELITSVQSLNIQLSRVLFSSLHVWLNLARVLQTSFMCGFRVWSITQNGILLSSMLKVVSSKEL